MPKVIINLTDDVKQLLASVTESKLEYRNKLTNRDANILTKMPICNYVFVLCFL